MPKAINKVVYGGNTIIDLTSDTVAASSMLSGVTAHNNAGVAITGTITQATIYTGTTAPSSSLGTNGDVYLQIVT